MIAILSHRKNKDTLPRQMTELNLNNYNILIFNLDVYC